MSLWINLWFWKKILVEWKAKLNSKKLKARNKEQVKRNRSVQRKDEEKKKDIFDVESRFVNSQIKEKGRRINYHTLGNY